MPARKSKKWQSRRKPSLGQLRRAHPASGATWNVQVVRGKMTSKCLWHACRALILGILLLLMGASMATIGYYADHLSMGHEIRGNATVRVKNESRGFHLNNLSYVGPIVMGFGGFIIVAACVMTFEARDSAAKVVPARFKISTSSRSNIRSNSSSGASNRRANGIMHQATRWDHHLGVFRTSPAEPPAPAQPLDRQALTAALIHFSKTLGNSPRQSPKTRRFSLSGSVPNLSSALTSNRSSINSAQLSPLYRRQIINNTNSNSLTTKQILYQQYQQQLLQQYQQQLQNHQHHHHHHKSKHHNHHHKQQHHYNDEIINDDYGNREAGRIGNAIGDSNIICSDINKTNDNDKSSNKVAGNGNSCSNNKKNRSNSSLVNNSERPFSKTRSQRTSTSLINRSSRNTDFTSGSLLHPGKLHQMHRHAMSVDESGPYCNTSDIDDSSLMSIIMLDSGHEKRIKDRYRRSDTSKRHILSRQKPIEKEEQHQQHLQQHNMIVASRYEERRRSSTTSDASNASRYYRASSATSRTNSIDSRSIQVELHSPEKHYQQQQYYNQNSRASPRSPRRQSSGSSIEREIRSQISICSEPSIAMRQLSGQSSLEPCVLEESPESEDRDKNNIENNDKNLNKSSIKNSKNNNIELNSIVNTISANIQDELHTPTHNRRTTNNHNNNNSTSNSPIYCNIKKQRPQSLKIKPNQVPIMKFNSNNKNSIKNSTKTTTTTRTTTTTTTIDEKPIKNLNPLQRSNSSRTFRSKPKLGNEYDTINRSAEDSSSFSSYFNYYNSTTNRTGTDDDFYDSLRVISERRSKILKTESESNSQYKSIENKEIKNNENKMNIENNKILIKSEEFNLDKKPNTINNLVSSIEKENLNAKETDDENLKENFILKTINFSINQPQSQEITTDTMDKAIIEITTATTQKTITLETENSLTQQEQSSSQLTSDNLTTCDTNTIELSSKNSIKLKDQNEFQKISNNNRNLNNCKCNSSNKCNNGNSNNNCNCDTNNSKDPFLNNIKNASDISIENESKVESKNDFSNKIKIECMPSINIVVPLQHHKLKDDNDDDGNNDGIVNNIKSIKVNDNNFIKDADVNIDDNEKLNKICVIPFDDNECNIENDGNLLKNGNNIDDKVILHDIKRDDNDNNSVSKIQNDKDSKDSRITIEENVN
ncbi:uncharacterized protein DDB_G0283357 [Condylostylus longicornis]|uniref:uncharacterized protein DDB_G0283357 n=1 Tax=Condylostylus longicornis TaxID=2530218 RepID=UPI00244E5729|nr:uncharacterized protein DDB_G0283357 [Condylostylus longicornis]